MDPYDITEPKDILPLLKKEFWEGLESKKWSDRKEQLTALKTLATAHPHLASGRDVDYGDVGRELRKVIAKDANVACVAEAIACCGALAKGLRAGYSATAKVGRCRGGGGKCGRGDRVLRGAGQGSQSRVLGDGKGVCKRRDWVAG